MSRNHLRVVVDTNVLVSAIVQAGSVPSQALSLAQKLGTVLLSEETASELNAVLARPKLSRFVTPAELEPTIAALCATAEWVAVVSAVRACRDPGDDKFLSLAMSGDATIIMTGDADLLALHPFEGVSILSPRQFLDAFALEQPTPEDAP